MKDCKQNNIFFIISNFNTDPEPYLEYCTDYLIYDQSQIESVKVALKKKYNKIQFVENTGHNLSDYFRFFYEYWENLPDTMLLAKGNMIGRHISKEFFERVVSNRVLTYLYSDRTYKEIPGVSAQLFDGHFLELNTSWYMKTKEYKYFNSFNSMLRFIFKDPLLPTWLVFSPGACFIVPKQHVKSYPKVFWRNLNKIVSYTYFPAEAYIVERMLPIIFSNIYELNDWMLDAEKFMTELDKVALEQHACHDSSYELLKHRIKTSLHRVITRLRL
jgi:hypothetical protein